jgi:TRAP-type C4-dicarboxylate transport system substrate-binding protein
MKRGIFKAMTVFSLVGLLSYGSSLFLSTEAKAQKQKTYNLKVAGFFAQGEKWRMEHWTKNVERMSGGRMKFQIFSGGELVPSAELLNACVAGVADIVFNVGVYVQSKIPIGGIETSLPFAWRRTHVDKGVVFDERGLLDMVREEYAKKGKIQYLGYWATDPYQLLTVKPCKNLDDLRKLKIRTAGEVAKVLNAVGVSTVFLPVEECYVALSTGSIDGLIYGGASGYYDMKFFEVAKYFYNPPFASSMTCNTLINQRLWDSLPDDLKAILEVATRELSLWMANNYVDQDMKKLALAKEQYGVKVITLPDSDMKVFGAAAQKLWDEYAKKGPECKKAVEILKQYHKDAGYSD